VIVIAPHSTNTPFSDKAEAQDFNMYDSTSYQRPGKLVLDFSVRDGRKGYHPRQIAEVIYKAITAKETSSSLQRGSQTDAGLVTY
jgi:hypothetical protein